MDVLDDMCRQVAIYWPPSFESPSGQPTFTAHPVEILVRWEQTTDVFIDRSGNEATSKAEVWVREEVQQLGVLWLSPYSVDDPPGSALQALAPGSGAPGDSSPFVPFNNPDVYEIRRYEEVPTFDNDDVEMIAYL